MTTDHFKMLNRIDEYNATGIDPTPAMLVRGMAGSDRAKAYRTIGELERTKHIRNVSTDLYGKEYRAS
jgi:hypothetical protein